MKYAKEQLSNLSNSKHKIELKKIITQELADKVFANKELSLAEEEYICGILKISKNINDENDIDISKYKSCKNYYFKNTYLKYFSDLNGHKKVLDYYGEISLIQKKKDVAFLHDVFIDWKKYIEHKTNGNELINYVAQETKFQIKELKKYCCKLFIGKNYYEYLEKSLILHGKYIYLLVKEFYQENSVNQQVVEINGNRILIDAFSYVHVMFRHYARSIKDHQRNKTYHFDQNIGFKIIPNTLFEILNCYNSIPERIFFDGKNITLKINNKLYSIWLKPFTKCIKGNIKIKYLRVQTFYPIEMKSELNKLVNHVIVDTECGFSFYINKI